MMMMELKKKTSGNWCDDFLVLFKEYKKKGEEIPEVFE